MEELNIIAIAQHALNRERVFRDRYNPIEILSDDQFIEVYRLRKTSVIELINQGLASEPTTARSYGVPGINQFCIALSILATGATFRKTAELFGVGKSSVQRIFWNIITNIANEAHRYINLPEDINYAAQQFFRIGKIPNVIGCIDGTFIPVLRPYNNEHVYVCRKGFHALNAMIINSADLQISYLSAKFPGNAHDSFVFRMSDLNTNLFGQFRGNGILLGDSAYALSERVLVPIQSPSTHKERIYNREFRKIRCSVERTIGIWKGRWRIIDRQGGPLRFQPENATKVIVATAILHNIAMKTRYNYLSKNIYAYIYHINFFKKMMLK